MNPRANRKAATIIQTVTFENPTRASWTVNSRRSMPSEMTITIIEPAGSGRVIKRADGGGKQAEKPPAAGREPGVRQEPDDRGDGEGRGPAPPIGLRVRHAPLYAESNSV